ncbi:HAD-like protein [Macrolepiota fuliginosa MF-IS2]|uniref:HAD-like protein n=1 Tax=Macrolepiota fuliginosa MF-IS2 TaxID=1400762 RepID=A0A9P5X6N0_9AGAR|nr:HAD-like protein [Macrolepiota fuliginosa MF-IS2]
MSKPRTRPLIRAVLIDVSGNLHVGTSPTPQAAEAFHRLRRSGIPFRLCSNTSKESSASLIHRLRKLGFNVEPSSNLSRSESSLDYSPDTNNRHDSQYQNQKRREVWTSIGAVAQYIQNQGLERPYFLLSPSAKDEIVLAPCGSGRSEGSGDSPYDSVVVGLTPELFDYSHLNTAFRILKGEHETQRPLTASGSRSQSTVPEGRTTPKSRPQLIATHKAKYIQTEAPPGLSLGPGPFVAALEVAANIKAHVIGKPTRMFFQTVIDNFYSSGELNEAEHYGKIAVVGDDIEADLGDGAIEMGLWRILVKTGKYRKGDESRPDTVPPDEVFESFAVFVESLLTEQACQNGEKRDAPFHKL